MPKRINNDDAMREYAEAHEQKNVQNLNATPIPGFEDAEPQMPKRTSLKEEQKQVSDNLKDGIHKRGLGFIELPVKDLPTKGIFYPDGTKFYIRAASGKEIFSWSQTNETEILEINNSLNYMLSRCLSVKMPGHLADYKDVKEIDRFYIILAIRDFTYPEGNNELMININEHKQIPLRKDNIDFIKFSDKLMKYYDKDNLCFTVSSITLKNGSVKKLCRPVHIYIPNVGVTEWLKDYVQKKSQKQELFDKNYVQLAPMLIADHRGLTDESYDAYIESFSYLEEDVNSYIDLSVIDLFKKSISQSIIPQFVYQDEEGVEQKAPLSFQGGIKSIFGLGLDNLL